MRFAFKSVLSNIFRIQKNYVPFVIVGVPRTGSTLVSLSLREHPSVLMYQELFNPTHKMQRVLLGGSEGINMSPEKYLSEKLYRRVAPGIRATGFKLILDQIDGNEFNEILNFLSEYPGMRVVFLRRNCVDAAVSGALALQSGHWHIMRGQKREEVGPQKVCLDVGWIYDYALKIKQEEEKAFALLGNLPSLQVYYMCLRANFSVEMDRIQEFLGLPVRHIVPMTEVVLSRGWKERVSNVQEVERVRSILENGY